MTEKEQIEAKLREIIVRTVDSLMTRVTFMMDELGDDTSALDMAYSRSNTHREFRKLARADLAEIWEDMNTNKSQKTQSQGEKSPTEQ